MRDEGGDKVGVKVRDMDHIVGDDVGKNWEASWETKQGNKVGNKVVRD